MSTSLADRSITALDGQWELILDRHAVGNPDILSHRKGFLAHDYRRKVTVPSALEETVEDYEGVAWYLRDFDVLVAEDTSYTLEFDAVNYRCELWVNGQPVGFHDGGYNRFSFDITQQINNGANHTILRVITPLVVRDDRIDGFGADEVPHQRGAITGGIWQSVRLIARPKVFINDVFLTGDTRGVARVQVGLCNDGLVPVRAAFKISLRDRRGTMQAKAEIKLSLEPGETTHIETLSVENVALWTLDDPQLYVCAVEIVSDTGTDATETKFGFREFSISGSTFTLNGEPMFLRTAFWEAVYPLTMSNPASLDLVRKEIELAKSAGFQMLRPWRKPLQPAILDLCDEMGILITAGLPVECMNYWPKATPMLEHRVRIEVESLITNARNHPSVVIWELFNEVCRDAMGRLKHPMSLLARSLDASRVIVDESGGWWGTGSHAYMPGSRVQVKINELHCYLPGPVSTADYGYLKTIGLDPDSPRNAGLITGHLYRERKDGVTIRAEDQPRPGSQELTYISEVGYGGLTDLERDIAEYDRHGNGITADERMYRALFASLSKALEDTGLLEKFGSVSSFCLESQEIQADSNLRQLEALRLRPGLAGYCLHAFTCGDWVYGAGILDMWRNPKKTLDTVRTANAPVVVAAVPAAPSFYVGDSSSVSIEFANSQKAFRGEVAAHIEAGGTTQPLFHQAVDIVRGTEKLAAVVLPSLDIAGSGAVATLTASIADDGGVVAEATRRVFVAPARLSSRLEVNLIDPEGKLATWSKGMNIAGNAPHTIVTAEDVTTDAERQSIARALERIKAEGGKVLFLNPPIDRHVDLRDHLQRRFTRSHKLGRENSLLESGIFPHRLKSRLSTGMWVPVAHAVASDDLTRDLPPVRFLNDLYADVVSLETVTNLPEGSDVAVWSVSYEWDTKPRNYLGVGDFWTGGDAFSVPHGKGQIVVTTMRVLDRAGRDPISDRLILNMLNGRREVTSQPA